MLLMCYLSKISVFNHLLLDILLMYNFFTYVAMIGSFIAIFVMAMLYEGLKVFREVIQQKKGNICSFTKRIGNSVHYEKVTSSIDHLPKSNYGTFERKDPK